MAEIINIYMQQVPKLRFIGKKYLQDDRVNGTFHAKWAEWVNKGWFDILEDNAVPHAEYEDGCAYVGLVCGKNTDNPEYWIGMLVSQETPVPKGFDYIDYDYNKLGVCVIFGNKDEIYNNKEDIYVEKLKESGFNVIDCKKGQRCFFERYGCPCYMVPDEDGNIVLDLCFYVE
ncbi:MAG: hypothetical protein WC332_05000 [Clostridia bacterium]|jgi:predicted transcriptional regulator YdeE